MRDTTSGGKLLLPKDTIYKDVVIIGNGPSGISLSYMLSGRWPYWDPRKTPSHPDELLRARLDYADSSKSLVEQDLIHLADGLEGRSTNPVSLLLDSLQNPCADLGMELPSMLTYKYHSEKQIDHIVLGKGPPGGSWHRMDPNLRTLSLSAWMSLPSFEFSTWESQQQQSDNNLKSNLIENHNLLPISANNNNIQNNLKNSRANKPKATVSILEKCEKCAELRTKSSNSYVEHNRNFNNNESESNALCCKCSRKGGQLDVIIDENSKDGGGIGRDEGGGTKTLLSVPKRNLSLKRQVSKDVQTRALVSKVAEYYESYVTAMNLNKYFMNDTIVSAITPILRKDNTRCKNARWIVQGTRLSTGKPFNYLCHSVVLANGASDLPNRLGLPAEQLGLPWIKHELPQLEIALEQLTNSERKNLKPVLIVGAGLSAADAVTICRSADVPVIHVYRNKTAGLDKMLPENVYPEYHEVHKMMRDSSRTYDLYTPLAEHTIVDVLAKKSAKGHTVTVQHLKSGDTKDIDISFCAILIGSRPDLRFLSNINAKDEVVERNDCVANLKIIEQNEEQWTVLSRKMTWLKNLCAKCKHLNICEWSKRNDYKKICGHNYAKSCECKKICCAAEDLEVDENYLSGIGEDATKPIDCKSNPIAVNKYTNEVLRTPKGLYSLGPLVGDNFVRFIPGGALAITSALHKEND